MQQLLVWWTLCTTGKKSLEDTVSWTQISWRQKEIDLGKYYTPGCGDTDIDFTKFKALYKTSLYLMMAKITAKNEIQNGYVGSRCTIFLGRTLSRSQKRTETKLGRVPISTQRGGAIEKETETEVDVGFPSKHLEVLKQRERLKHRQATQCVTSYRALAIYSIFHNLHPTLEGCL